MGSSPLHLEIFSESWLANCRISSSADMMAGSRVPEAALRDWAPTVPVVRLCVTAADERPEASLSQEEHREELEELDASAEVPRRDWKWPDRAEPRSKLLVTRCGGDAANVEVRGPSICVCGVNQKPTVDSSLSGRGWKASQRTKNGR